MKPSSSHIPPGRRRRIAIVGGGPGGLFTAWHLEQLASEPPDLTILEASERLGGKVLTPTFSTAAVRYEAGAAEFYDYSPVGEDPLRDLIESFGLPTVSLGGAAVHVDGLSIANTEDVSDAFGPDAHRSLQAFDAWARGAMTPREFYESGGDHDVSAAPAGRFDRALAALPSPELRRYLQTMIHSDLATPPAATSIGYGLQNYLMNDPAYMRLYCIAGGNEQLITALAARIGGRIRLSTRVERIASDPDGGLRLGLRTADDAVVEETFDLVVLALPMAPLKQLVFDDPALAAAIGRHVEHHDHPAHYLRVTVLLDRPLSPAAGDDGYLMLDAFGGCCLYVESGREPAAERGVLGWLLGGDAAEQFASLPDDQLLAAVLDSLPEGLATCREHVAEARVHRWCGAVSGLPGGWQPLPQDRRHRPAADSHPGLFVVGDYLYDSTLNGVLDSAEYVAGWIAADSHPT